MRWVASWVNATSLFLFTLHAAQAEPRPETLAKCAQCHGPSGNSTIPQFPSIAGQPAIFIENQLVIMREGLRDVPAMKEVVDGMKDEEISELAAYFAAQSPEPGPAGSGNPEAVRLGAEIAHARLCATCHRPDYSGQQQVPRLAGQHQPYLLESMKQFRDHPGPGRDTIMASTLRGLSDADLNGLSHYLAQFKPK